MVVAALGSDSATRLEVFAERNVVGILVEKAEACVAGHLLGLEDSGHEDSERALLLNVSQTLFSVQHLPV